MIKFRQFYLSRNCKKFSIENWFAVFSWRTFDLHYHPLRSNSSIDFFASSIDVKKIVINCDRKALLRNKSTGSRKNLDNRGGSSFCWLSYYAKTLEISFVLVTPIFSKAFQITSRRLNFFFFPERERKNYKIKIEIKMERDYKFLLLSIIKILKIFIYINKKRNNYKTTTVILIINSCWRFEKKFRKKRERRNWGIRSPSNQNHR